MPAYIFYRSSEIKALADARLPALPLTQIQRGIPAGRNSIFTIDTPCRLLRYGRTRFIRTDTATYILPLHGIVDVYFGGTEGPMAAHHALCILPPEALPKDSHLPE